ncbi:MAG: hypothetical protein ACLQRH_00230 [Acidimicrobiales bacterium]
MVVVRGTLVVVVVVVFVVRGTLVVVVVVVSGTLVVVVGGSGGFVVVGARVVVEDSADFAFDAASCIGADPQPVTSNAVMDTPTPTVIGLIEVQP